ncbi:DMT family transporter [Enterovirga rhinocerotis]|uniref:Threonine/homoserine efflux transporter RhtA n=1 Tax=Enterovirga rhinocerotis TaxID=1339210 RepID=A0A4R7BQ63_9HYPH|nr:DMT family transporter [Enterovirga rhinocerotis]TDR87283.1 threonine/homoserine efflux transporter RhtA [Enterovirga rhinocerotis]
MASLPRSDTAGSGLALPLAALILGAWAMGMSPIFVRLASPEVGPFASAFWRVALALPLLYGWMRIEDRTGSGRRGPIRPAALLAGAAFAGDLLFWHLSIMATSVANATFFATTAPVFVVLATWLVLRRRVSGATLGGLALCLAGGAALVFESLAVDPGRLRGDLYGVVTATFFAMYLLAMARAREGEGAARVTFWSSVVTAAILLVAAVLFDRDVFWAQRAETWAALAGLALVSQAGGQGLLAVALGRLPAVFSSLVIFLEAVFAAAAGWIVLGEPLSLVQYGGGALILLGIVLARPKRPTEGEAP